MGTTEEEPASFPRPEYIAAIRALPLLTEQGDGMKSFIGLMLGLLAGQFQIVLVDEPEAFLHPPQARLLGRKLATEVPRGTQVFVATHSSDVLQGLLDPDDANVTVVRLTRRGHESVCRSRTCRAASNVARSTPEVFKRPRCPVSPRSHRV